MHKISFFVPEDHLDQVKNALFEVGVGKFGNYDCCSWEVKGRGQYRPLKGSQAFKGTLGQLEKVEEYKVELFCSDHLVHKAITTLKEAHPYEEVVYTVLKLDQDDPA